MFYIPKHQAAENSAKDKKLIEELRSEVEKLTELNRYFYFINLMFFRILLDELFNTKKNFKDERKSVKKQLIKFLKIKIVFFFFNFGLNKNFLKLICF